MMPNRPYEGIIMKLGIIERDKKEKNWRINLLLITKNAPNFSNAAFFRVPTRPIYLA